MFVNDKIGSFEKLSDWLTDKPNYNLSSKEKTKIKIQKNMIPESNNSKPVEKKPVPELNKNNQKPKIDLMEKNGVVTGLKITCVCGEIININFEYDKQSGLSYIKKNL